MASTFTALAAEADFEAVEPADVPPREEGEQEEQQPPPGGEGRVVLPPTSRTNLGGIGGLGGLVYNIQIQLPESRDPAVYDALFRSLKTHLFNE